MRPRSGVPLVGLIVAEFLSLLGNQVAAVAMPVLVLRYTGSPLLTGVAGAGNLVPYLLAAFYGGRAIDRLGAWNLSVFSDVLSSLSVLALPLAFLALGGGVRAALLFLLVLLGALFDPTGSAARQTLVPGVTRLAGQPLERVNSLRGGLENGADFFGPVLGVALIGAMGVTNAFFVNAASFLLCALLFATTVPRRMPWESEADATEAEPAPEEPRPSLSGIVFLFRHAPLRPLAAVGAAAGLVLLPFLGVLLPVLATRTFGSVTLLGVCLSAFGLAATVGALSFSALSRRLSRSAIYYGGLLVTDGAIALCGVAAAPYQVVLAAALAGLLLGAGNPLQQTVLQEETPEAMAGRVFTALSAFQFAAGSLGLVAVGVVAEYAPVRAALVVTGSLLMAVSVAGALALPLRPAAATVADAPVSVQ